MKVVAEYPVTKTITIEIPDELAKAYDKAREAEDTNEQDWQWDRINEFIQDYITEKEKIEYALDWLDWEEVD